MMNFSRGARNFSRCEVKKVVFRTFYSTPGSSVSSRAMPKDGVETDIKYDALLKCPKTEENPVDTSYVSISKEGALQNLQSLAGTVVCKNCTYSTMSPLQVEETRLQEAETRANRQRVANQLVELEQAHAHLVELGMPEVRAIDEAHLLPGQTL